MAEDAAATAVNVLANDTDVDGGPKAIASVTQPTHGTVVITGGGTGLTYQPDANYCNGGAPTDDFTYTLNGGSIGTVKVTVSCVDDPPVAVDDSKTVAEDAAATAVNVLANDTDVDGGPKSIGSVTQPVHGTVVITGGGTGLTYEPNANYCNTPPPFDTFTYTLNGGSVGTVKVTVTCVDDPPVAVDDSATMAESAAATAVNVLANDTDVDGGPKSIGSVTQPVHGTVVITGGGTGLTYEPDANYCNGGAPTDDFTYTLNGGSVGTVKVTVTCVDDPPVAVDDTKTVTEDAAATAVDVLANDTDVDGGPKAIASVTQPAHGTVVITGGGTGLTYEPNANYCNTPPPFDTFTYTLNGGSVGTVKVTVTCVDDPPVAVDDSKTVVEDAAATAVDVLANDTDVDGGPKSVQSVTQPAHGTVVITGGGTGLTYQPDANYCNGGAPTDDFTYTLNGGSIGTVKITVSCVDDPPVAVDDSKTVTEDAAATAVNVLANDTDVDGGPKSIGSVTQPVHGTVVITGGGTGLTYEPDANYCNTPPPFDTFTYTLNGGSVGTVKVTVTCVDDPPVAVDDAKTVAEDAAATAVNVLANDTDVDGGPKAIASVTQPAHGTVVITGGGTGLTYQPDANYCNGGAPTDDFTYTLNGGSTGTVRVTVTCDAAPVAVDDTKTVAEDAAATAVDVLANDTDSDGGPMSIASRTQPGHGTVVITGGGTGLTYQPDANYCNTPTPPFDTFTYTLTPGSSSATVSMTVTCVDDPPVAVDDTKTVAEDAAATAVDVLANDTDSDGGPMSIASVTQPTHGTVVITGGGTGLTYEPDANYCNTPTPPFDTFTYTLNGGSNASVSMTVTCVDDAPVAVNDTATVAEDSGASPVNVLANDTDSDGGPKSVTAVTQPAHGTVAITGGGTAVSYTPDANYCNTPTPPFDTFTYTVSPGGSTATVSVTVTCVDDPPVAVDDYATVVMNASATAVPVLANDTDIDGGPKSIFDASDPAHGTVVITGFGTGLTYQPDPGYCNDGFPFDTFTYILDGGSSAVVRMTVTCDVAPTAVDDAATVVEDDPATAVDVLANDTDPDGGTKSIASVTQPAHGTVVITGGGTGLTYTPNANYCNTPTPPFDTFTYTLTPGSSSATVSMTVTCVDDPPVAVADSATVAKDDPATAVAVLANDTDVDGGPKAIALVTQPTHGSVAITGGGTGLTYQPTAGYCNNPPGTSPDTFTYTLDPGGSSATVSMTVTCSNAAPTAGDDAFTAVGNTVLVINAPGDGAPSFTGPKKSVDGDVLANDTDPDGPNPLAVQAGTFPTDDGGTVVLEADGDFVFTPAATGCADTADFFDYTVTDGNTPTAGTDVGRVDITLSGCVWYVNNLDPGNAGTSTAPFDTLAQAQAASSANQTIFVFDGDDTTAGYSAGITLANGQALIGEAAPLQVGPDVLWPGVPSHRPSLTNNGADVITLASGNTVRGLQVDPQGAGGGIAAGAGDTGGRIDDVRITDTGPAGTEPALEIVGTSGAFDISDLVVDTSGAAGQTAGSVGVKLLNNAGTVNFLPAGTISITTSGARGLDAAGTNLGAGSVVDSVTVTGSGSGAVSLLNTSGTTTFANLDLTTSSGAPAAFALDSAGNVTVPGAGTANVSSNGGPAVFVQHTPGPALAFDSVSAASSAAEGILLRNIGSGTFSASGGSLTSDGANLSAFAVWGGSGDVSYTGDILDGAGDSASVVGRTGGTVTLSGSITDGPDTGGGLWISGNNGGATVFSGPSKVFSTGSRPGVEVTYNLGHAAVSFTGGGLHVDTTIGTAFKAHASDPPAPVGGTVSVTGPGNTLTSSAGTALSVTDTDIGASGLTFDSISANGAANGIRLDSTGAAGGLTVTGTGGACATTADACTGGTITATTQDAVSLTSTRQVTLQRMKIRDNLGNGVRGDNVTDVALRDSVVDHNGDDPATDEAGLHFTDLAGTSEITRTVVANSPEDEARIVNSSATLDQLTVTDSTFRDTATVSPGNNGLLVQADGGKITADVLGSTFLRNRANGLQAITNGTGSMDIEVDDSGTAQSAFDDNNIGVNLAHNSSGTYAFGVRDLTVDGLNVPAGTGGSASPINVNLGSAATTPMVGKVTGNTLTNSNSTTGPGIRLLGNGSATLTALLDANTISQIANRGIEVIARDGSNRVNATITNNQVTLNHALSGDAVRVDAGAVGTDTTTICADIRDNTATTTAAGLFGIRVRQRFPGTSFILEGYGGAAADDPAVASYLSTGNNAATTSADHGGPGFTTIGNCPGPP